jgi:hypothetical protein
MPGARCARSRAWCVENTRVSHHGHTGITRHSPRNGFNGFLRALPGDRAFLPPSSLRSLLLKNLMPASGHQDHTTSPSASGAARLASPKRPPHPAPTSVTIMIRPLCPQNLPECANGRFSQNRPLLELSPLRPKGGRACDQSEGQLRWSSSTRIVARASSPNRARKGVDDGTKRSRCRRY